jgi:hypothetical protein
MGFRESALLGVRAVRAVKAMGEVLKEVREVGEINNQPLTVARLQVLHGLPALTAWSSPMA